MNIENWIANPLDQKTRTYFTVPGHADSPASIQPDIPVDLILTVITEKRSCIAVCGISEPQLLIAMADKSELLLAFHSECTAIQKLIANVDLPDRVIFIHGDLQSVTWRRLPDFMLASSKRPISPAPPTGFPSEPQKEWHIVLARADRPLLISPQFRDSEAGVSLVSSFEIPPSFEPAGVLRACGNGCEIDLHAVFITADRVRAACTVTRIVRNASDQPVVHKALLSDASTYRKGLVSLHPCSSNWQTGFSLQAVLLARLNDERLTTIQDTFSPVLVWLEKLRLLASADTHSDKLAGQYLDAIWVNSYSSSKNCEFIDLEWHWQKPIPVAVLFIRAAYVFLVRHAAGSSPHRLFEKQSIYRSINSIARGLGIQLDRSHFSQWLDIESSLQAATFGGSPYKYRLTLLLRLYFSALYRVMRGCKQLWD